VQQDPAVIFFLSLIFHSDGQRRRRVIGELEDQGGGVRGG
jgi:hypothetical protein